MHGALRYACNVASAEEPLSEVGRSQFERRICQGGTYSVYQEQKHQASIDIRQPKCPVGSRRCSIRFSSRIRRCCITVFQVHPAKEDCSEIPEEEWFPCGAEEHKIRSESEGQEKDPLECILTRLQTDTQQAANGDDCARFGVSCCQVVMKSDVPSCNHASNWRQALRPSLACSDRMARSMRDPIGIRVVSVAGNHDSADFARPVSLHDR